MEGGLGTKKSKAQPQLAMLCLDIYRDIVWRVCLVGCLCFLVVDLYYRCGVTVVT